MARLGWWGLTLVGLLVLPSACGERAESGPQAPAQGHPPDADSPPANAADAGFLSEAPDAASPPEVPADAGPPPQRLIPADGGLTLLRASDFANGRVELLLPQLGADEVVVIAPVHAEQSEDVEGLRYTVSTSGLTGSRLPPPVAQPSAQGQASSPSAELQAPMQTEHLRALEHDQRQAQLLERARTGSRRNALAAAASGTGSSCPPPYVVGERRCTFWVPVAEQPQLTATLRHASASALWFLADEDTSSLTDAELQALADSFESGSAPTVRRYFGEPSDVDGNGKVIMLFTQRLAESARGITSRVDLYPEEEAMRVLGRHSNEAEIFYVAPFDPNSGRSDGLASLPPVLAHEYKHVVSMGRRFITGASFEESWAEELAGFGSKRWHPQSFAYWSLPRPQNFRVAQYPFPKDCNRGPYGYGFLFSWRVAEQRGHDTFWPLWTGGPGAGAANFEAHAGQALSELLLDWAATLLLDHRGWVDGYDYEALNLRDGSWTSLGTLPLEDGVSGLACSVAYLVGRGGGTDARALLHVTNGAAPYALVIRVHAPPIQAAVDATYSPEARARAACRAGRTPVQLKWLARTTLRLAPPGATPWPATATASTGWMNRDRARAVKSLGST